MGVKRSPGTADLGEAVTWPGAEVAGRLRPELVDCSLVLQSLDS